MSRTSESGLGLFERYLSFWVVLCIVVGVAVGKLVPAFPDTISEWEYARVSIPVAILIWVMIYPMMVKVDFGSIVGAVKQPKGLTITWVTNWAIKPFTMYLFAYVFFFMVFSSFISEGNKEEYLAGAVLLGAAPCTAMVFVWSHLSKGDPGYTLVQVATNDLIILIAFVPIVSVLLGVGGLEVPYDTLILSVVLFVVVPLTAGYLTRSWAITSKGEKWLEDTFFHWTKDITVVGLLLTLVIIFSFQGDTILEHPADILLIAIPLSIQTYVIFFIAYLWARYWRLSHSIATPASMIGASNFFELAVAVAISLYGLESGAALVTVVGVLVEVPIMLSLVAIANRTRGWFPVPDTVKKDDGGFRMTKKTVLFICTHNSARSQMAEGILRHLYGSSYKVYSAGTEATEVSPFAIMALEEMGIDASSHTSKKLDRFLDTELDYVVTVCDNANEACPIFPGGKERIHKSFRDPSAVGGGEEEVLKVFRQVRDEIQKWIVEFFG